MTIDNKFLLDLYSSEDKSIYINIDENTILKLSAEKISKEEYSKSQQPKFNSNTTIVTGLWDLGKHDLSDTFKRSYEHYKQSFAELLKTPANMYIYVSKEDEEFIWKHRSHHNTYVKVMELEEFDTWFDFFDKVQDIRNSNKWKNRKDWVKDSPQAKLKYYNPIVMSKLFLLNNVTLVNPFNTENFFWVDAGITNTVSSGYFTHDKVFNNLDSYISHVNKFLFISYPYKTNPEIHGFERAAMSKYSRTDIVRYVCRGGFFGGNKVDINRMNGVYYGMLSETLNASFMGTEESIFTILAHKYPSLIHRYEIKDDGLIWPFFEDLKNIESLIAKTPKYVREKEISHIKTNLYILGFNSPKQFERMCKYIQKADKELFEKTDKFLINNSTNELLFGEYDRICEEYNFTEIHKDNIGICGGRQFIAEHFDESDADFYLFFEDDMYLNSQEYESLTCESGMIRYVNNLYNKIVRIMLKEKFDFLKLSFSEFYGNNSIQWAWYNVPQTVRNEIWPDYNILPEAGIDLNAPKTNFKNVGYIDNTGYISGEIYYSNWPQMISREGNKKMFLNTKWEHPYEQTWMSFMFQETLQGNIKPAILLASPVTHERFEYYKAEERREN